MAAKGKKGGNAATKRKSRAKRTGSGIDQLVDLQKKSLARYVTYVSHVARQLADGDMSLSRWVSSYATVWKGLATDMQDTANVLLKNAAKVKPSAK